MFKRDRNDDTAIADENEATIWRAIETASIDGDDVLVTTKIKGYPEFLEPDRLIEAVESSLQRLGTDSPDLVLLHWWYSGGDTEEVFGAF